MYTKIYFHISIISRLSDFKDCDLTYCFSWKCAFSGAIRMISRGGGWRQRAAHTFQKDPNPLPALPLSKPILSVHLRGRYLRESGLLFLYCKQKPKLRDFFFEALA